VRKGGRKAEKSAHVANPGKDTMVASDTGTKDKVRIFRSNATGPEKGKVDLLIFLVRHTRGGTFISSNAERAHPFPVVQG